MKLSDDEIHAMVLTRKMLKRAPTPVPQFLRWVAERLVVVHGESELLDFVHALKDRADQLDEISKLLGVHRALD